MQDTYSLDLQNLNSQIEELVKEMVATKLEGYFFVKIPITYKGNDAQYVGECWEKITNYPVYKDFVSIHSKEIFTGSHGNHITLKIAYKYRSVLYGLGVEFIKEFCRHNIDMLSVRIASALQEQKNLTNSEADLIRKFIFDEMHTIYK